MDYKRISGSRLLRISKYFSSTAKSATFLLESNLDSPADPSTALRENALVFFYFCSLQPASVA